MIGDAPTAKSARRALEILEFFSARHTAASVAEISDALSFPQSSTTMLLRELTRLGFLERRASDRRYAPTLRVMLLGAWLQDRLIGQGSLLGLMEGMRRRLNLTALIGLQRSIQAQYILALRRPRSDDSLRTGTSRPILHAAIGKALLMEKSDDEIMALIQHANAVERDPALVVRPAAFLEEMAESRSRGWVESSGLLFAGVRVIAMPLPQLEDQPSLSIGLGGPLRPIQQSRAEIVTELRSVCTALAHPPFPEGRAFPARA